MRAVPENPERSDWLSEEDLAELRARADWRQVFAALGLNRAPRRGNAGDWWARSPFAEDRQPSFHMNDKGWYCFATQQGGGVLELVEQVLRVNCYEAGRWLIAQGLSSVSHSPPPPPASMATTGGGGSDRAVTEEQAEAEGKWRFYEGFHKSLELYNRDHLLLDSRAGLQARDTGQVLVVEGCFDVARLIEAGLLNVVATFGAHLSDPQVERLRQLARRLGVNRFRFWYDRDRAGQAGQEQALARLQEAPDLVADGFVWETELPAPAGRRVRIPAAITDPAECSVKQLQWLRKQKVI